MGGPLADALSDLRRRTGELNQRILLRLSVPESDRLGTLVDAHDMAAAGYALVDDRSRWVCAA